MSADDEILEAIQEANAEVGRRNYERWRSKNRELAEARDDRLAAAIRKLDHAVHQIFYFYGCQSGDQTPAQMQLYSEYHVMTREFRSYAKSAAEIDEHMIPVIASATKYLAAVHEIAENAKARNSSITRTERDSLAMLDCDFKLKANAAKTYYKASGKDKALGVVLMIIGAVLSIVCVGICIASCGYGLFRGEHKSNIKKFQQSVDGAVNDLINQVPKPRTIRRT